MANSATSNERWSRQGRCGTSAPRASCWVPLQLSLSVRRRPKPNRTALPEYARYRGLVGEIQLRTVLQHAWAEIEHDIQYKSVETIPAPVRRRFMALAGPLEIADREFQAVQLEDETLRLQARTSVQEGRLEQVEITGDALKAYLDKTLGADWRIAKWSYEYMARLLRRLGFSNFQQIADCLAPYNDDSLSRLLHGTRQGQLTRFEDMLLAAMGDRFIERHHLYSEAWYRDMLQRRLDKIRALQVPSGQYDPGLTPPVNSAAHRRRHSTLLAAIQRAAAADVGASECGLHPHLLRCPPSRTWALRARHTFVLADADISQLRPITLIPTDMKSALG